MEALLHILHLEDNPKDAELVKEMLAGNGLSCEITRVETREAFTAAVERERYDLILADYSLPGFTGLDALKLAVAIRPDIPFVFVSGTMGEEFAVLTLHMGATDYVLKNKLVRLPAAVRRAIIEAEATATRMRMEESLRFHATRMKSIMETSLDAIIVMDSRGVILDWNVQAESMFGWQKREVLGRTVAETIIPLQHREAHTRGLIKFLATGEGAVLNKRIDITALHRTGREFSVELAVTASNIKDQWQFTAFIMDTSERKRAERRLAAQYAVTQVLADSPTLEEAGAKILQVLCECLGWEVGSLWRVDRDANLLRCIEIWQAPKAEAAEFIADSRKRTFAPGVGMPGRVWSQGEPAWISDVLKDPNFPRAPMAAKAGLHGAVGFPIKVGKHVYGIIEFFSCTVREPDSDLMQMAGEIGIKIGQFIERKQTEDALQERDLAKLSAERANQAKSEFLSRMSHELRTPLNAVLGFAQLLEMDALSGEQQEHVQHILKGGRHLLALINEVLDIARIEAGRMTFSLEPVSLSSVLGEAVDLIRPQAGGRNIQLVVQSLCNEAIYVRADRQRVKQVLLNLLSNGVKYNKDGGSLTVSCQAVPVGRYRVTVTDTGGGIPSALMSRLFTPFDRLGADATTEGTGLGLVLSRNLVTAMGGTLEVDSVEGRGTSVSVELALSEPPAARETTMAPGKGLVTAPVSGGAFTVLYIEDNLPNYQLVERLVAKRSGVRLLGAMQGKLGVELAVAHRPDVILLDLNLPDIQGDEVLLRLREHPETATIPVVMLSADAMQRQVDKLLAAGAQKYLTKPIEVVQFYALLDELMAKKGGR
jgi:two-component system, cell cycle sensor histidine kinase and response regulator CckA